MQPHNRAGLKDLDIDDNLQVVERQNVFISLFIERLNDSGLSDQTISKQNQETKFTLRITSNDWPRLDRIIDTDKLKEATKLCGHKIPTFIISFNDGTGNYRPFLEANCLPADGERFRQALIGAAYDYDRVITHIVANRPDLKGQQPDDPTSKPA